MFSAQTKGLIIFPIVENLWGLFQILYTDGKRTGLKRMDTRIKLIEPSLFNQPITHFSRMVFFKFLASPEKYSQDNRALESSPEKHPCKKIGSFSVEEIEET